MQYHSLLGAHRSWLVREGYSPSRLVSFVALSTVLLASGCADRRPSDVSDPNGCSIDLECPPGSLCIEGACMQLCNVDDDCGEELACTDGLCQPSALPDGSSCVGRLSTACASGHCDGKLCCSGGDCCNTVADCAPSFSTASICSTLDDTTDCQGTRVAALCVDHVCASEVVDDDQGCAGRRRSCPNNLRAIECTAAVDQPAPVCPAGCSTSADCADGFVCDGSACVVRPGVGAPCGVGTPCASDDLKCENGVCCAAGSASCCTASTTCDGGLRCNTTVATCVTSCTDYGSADCADSARICIDDECVDKVPDGGACTVSAECASGNCDQGRCCNGDCSSCVLPWGETIAHGQSRKAYASGSVECGEICAEEQRNCVNGVLSGSYTAQSCSMLLCGCWMPWGESVPSGQSRTAYASASVTCGNNCVSEARSCHDGVLSGNYTHQSCSVQSCASCTNTPWGTMAHNESKTAYASSTPAGPCTSQIRKCTDGSLSGNYTATSCTPGCTGTPWGDVASGYSNMAYASSTPAGPCSGQTRTCTNGTMNGNYPAASCTPGCTGTPWGDVPSGYSNTAYQESTPAGPCVSQVRTCTNGAMDGSYTQTSCQPCPWEGDACQWLGGPYRGCEQYIDVWCSGPGEAFYSAWKVADATAFCLGHNEWEVMCLMPGTLACDETCVP